MEEWKILIDVFALIVSGIACAISKKSFDNSKKANEASNEANKKANQIEQGNIELRIREMISTARFRHLDMGVKVGQNPNEAFVAAFNSATEDLLNAYEEACTKYIDEKIDKDRFKKSYTNELRNIWSDKNFDEFFTQRPPRFPAIAKVCDEWFNLEN